jgi:hypothetical protein
MRSEHGKSRRYRCSAFVLAVVLLLGAAPSFAQLEGVWESVQRSEGGIGVTYEFQEDGNVCVSPGAMVDFVYRFVGGQVAVLNADLSEDPETVMAFRLENGRLVTDMGNEAPALERVGEQGTEGSEVVGLWKYSETDETDEELGGKEAALIRRNTRIRLTSTGKMLLRIPFVSECSQYQVDGSTLSMELRGQKITPAIRIEGDTLILTSRAGDEASFSRVAP